MRLKDESIKYILDLQKSVLPLIYCCANKERLKVLDAILKYMFSIRGLVDLFSFLPEYMPFFFPGGTVAFRMVRIVRIFRLFRINYYFYTF